MSNDERPNRGTDFHAAIEAGKLIGTCFGVKDLTQEEYRRFAIYQDATGNPIAMDLDKFKRRSPERIRATQRFADVDSFSAYVNEFKSDGTHEGQAVTRIYLEPRNMKFTATLDDHSPSCPQWTDHRAICEPQKTPLWELLTEKNKKYMSQLEFAEMIEENADVFTDPDSATMLKLAQNLQVKRTVDYQSASRLANGQIAFKVVENNEPAGDIKIPERFVMHLEPYIGMDAGDITAAFRYRIDRQTHELTLSYALLGLEAFQANLAKTLSAQVTEATGLRVFNVF